MARRAMGYGGAAGAAYGMAVMLVLLGYDANDYSARDLAAAAVIYLPTAGLVGALTGTSLALLSSACLLAGRVWVGAGQARSRLTAGAVTLLISTLGILAFAVPWAYAVPATLVAAATAAALAPRVIGLPR